MDKVISVIASPISFLIVISVVIVVHELGHYWTGRIFNAAAESFAFGFGKPIFEVKDKRGTRWRINWLPMGGFVKFVGEIQAPQDSHDDKPVAATQLVGRAYTELGPLKRIAISFGGPLSNFIFAILVFSAMGMGLGVPEADHVRIKAVAESSPAAAAGFRAGDEVLVAGGRKVMTSNDVSRATFLSAGEPVTYEILRAGEKLTLTATPVEAVERNDDLKLTEKVGRVGLSLADEGSHIKHLNPIESVSYGVAATGDALSNTMTVLRRLIMGRDGLDKMSGPVGIFSLTDKVTDMHMKQDGVAFDERLRQTALRLLELAALLSIGVGFFNLLPIPILDGGAILICLVELVMGRQMPEKAHQWGMAIGLVCIVTFALVITWQDIARLLGIPAFPGGS
jgi:regulator of sigma E protease